MNANLYLIFLLPFFISLLGIVKIVEQKLILFKNLKEPKKKRDLARLRESLLKLNIFKDFSATIFVQKNLKKLAIFFLSLYNKMKEIEQRFSKKIKIKIEKEDFWKKLKK
jgi:hypothetical protein